MSVELYTINLTYSAHHACLDAKIFSIVEKCSLKRALSLFDTHRLHIHIGHKRESMLVSDNSSDMYSV